MYAIVEVGSKQYKISPNQEFQTEKINEKEGKIIELEKVLLFCDGDNLKIGRPYLKDAKVLCEVKKHLKGKKVIAFKYRRRKNSKTKKGYRQLLTELRVKQIKTEDRKRRNTDGS